MKAATAIEWRVLRHGSGEQSTSVMLGVAAVAGARIMSRDDADAGAAGADERGAQRVRDQTLPLHQ